MDRRDDAVYPAAMAPADGSDEVFTNREVLEQGSQAFFVAVGEAAKQVPAVAANPGWQALLAITMPLMGLAVARGAYRLFAPRTAALAKGYAKAFNDEPQKVADHAAARADDPDYHETMYRTFRAMVDAADPSVVETLGYLAGTYTSARKKPDVFFRGLGRLLCDLDSGELDDLRALLHGIREGNAEEKHEWLDVVIDSQMDPTSVHVVEGGPNGTLSEYDHEEFVRIVLTAIESITVGKHPSAARLFLLLKREGLAETLSLNPEDEPSNRRFPLGDREMYISAKTLDAILASIDPQPAVTKTARSNSTF